MTEKIDLTSAERTAEFLSEHDTATGNLARAFLQLRRDFTTAFQAGLDLQQELDDARADLDEARNSPGWD